MSRFGEEAQRKTFLMSNVAPQSPRLNRGIWREIEHRIADLFTSKWGEIWVIVGSISDGKETLCGTGIDIPTAFYQIVAAKTDNEIRAVAFLCDQHVPWKAWPRHYLVSIDELEERSGLDFFSELDDSVEEKLESQTATRLLPTGFSAAFKALEIHFEDYR
jgi:endonuclease G